MEHVVTPHVKPICCRIISLTISFLPASMRLNISSFRYLKGEIHYKNVPNQFEVAAFDIKPPPL